GSSLEIIGKTIALDGDTYAVVGVMPAGFVFPGMTGVLFGFFFSRPADVWLPLAMSADVLKTRSDHSIFAVGRLKPGVSLAQAGAEMDALTHRIEKANPGNLMGTHARLLA